MSSGPDGVGAADGRGAVPRTGPRVGPLVGNASAVAGIRIALRGIRRPFVLIDGPSGAGKSTLADALVRDWPGHPPTLVRLDDVYPGWSGLDAAARTLARTLVAPWRRNSLARYRRWDWVANAPGADVAVQPGPALLVEGCGAFAVVDPTAPAVRIWVDAADDVRRRRALDRDGGAYDAYWEMWDRQWRAHLRRVEPRRRASVLVGASADAKPGSEG